MRHTRMLAVLAALSPSAALACGPSSGVEATFFILLAVTFPLGMLGLEAVLVKLTNGVFVSELPTWFRGMAMVFTLGVVVTGVTLGVALSAEGLVGLGIPLMLIQLGMLARLVQTLKGAAAARAFL